MQKLSLKKRPATIGGSINTRTEMHGKEPVPAHDIPVKGLIVDGPELNLLLGIETAYDALYMEGEDRLVIPRFTALAPFTVIHKFQGAKVTIATATEDLEFSNAGLKDIVVEPKTGGHTEIHFKLQVTSKDKHLDVPGLLNAPVSISIRSAELEQKRSADPELPLDHGNPTPEEVSAAQDEEAEALAERESGMSKKIRRSEAKKGRREAARAR